MQWAILGTGSVSRKFCLGLAALGGRTKVGAVASRNPDNARAFTTSLGLGQAVETYEAAATAHETQAVYIATPPDLHETHAKLAFAAGKPALIEKPLASDAETGARIAEAAAAAGVFAMEALWTRFQPLPQLIATRLQAIGPLKGFQGRFMTANIPDPAASLFAPPSGGALLHRGVYPLSLARMYLGPVRAVQATARLGETGVDEDISLTLTHENGALSDIRASLSSHDSNACTLWGAEGRIEITGPVWRPEGACLIQSPPIKVTTPTPRRFEAFRESRIGQRIARLRQRFKPGGAEMLKAPYLGNGYGHEAEHLMDCVARGATQSEIMPLGQSVEILEIVDEALGQVGARRSA